MGSGLAEQVSSFYQRHIEGQRPLFLGDVKDELEGLLLPGGFEKPNNELIVGQANKFYVQRNREGINLFTAGYVFEHLFNERNEGQPRPHHLSLIQLVDQEEADYFVERYYRLMDTWDLEGATHRGMTHIDGNRPGAARKHAKTWAIAGAAAGISLGAIEGSVLRAVFGALALGAVGAVVSYLNDIRNFRGIDNMRTGLRKQYEEEFQEFREDYEETACFDLEALQKAAGLAN